MRCRGLACAMLGATLIASAVMAHAKGPKESKKEPAADSVTAQAKDAFMKGTAAVNALQWSEALGHFERADALKPVPVVTFNIGVCQRALGRYVLAKSSFEKVLKDSTGMAEAQIEEAKTYASEINKLLAHITVTLDPPNAKLSVDGRPLIPMEGAGPNVLVAGVAPAGEGTAPTSPKFELVIDPGSHLIQATHPGHGSVLVNKTFGPQAREALVLKLDELPANIHVESDQVRAIVTVDGRDVGMAPIDVARPAGRYRVQVLKKGFVTYETTLTLTAGQKANLSARMIKEKELITQKWWFWGGTAALVAGGITATYLLTRPEQSPPDYQRGSLGWLAQPR